MNWNNRKKRKQKLIPAAPKVRRPASYQPHFDILEERLVFANDALTLTAGGALQLTIANNATVTLSGAGNNITFADSNAANQINPDANATANGFTNTQSSTGSLTAPIAVTSIVIDGPGGSQTFVVSNLTNTLPGLTVNANVNSTLLSSAAINTGAGTQAYNGAVTVTTGANLTGSTVTFGNTVDDMTANTDALTVTGAAVFNGVVGTTPLLSLHVTGAATFNAGASTVTTSGAQTYSSTVTLGASLTLTSTGNGISIVGTTNDNGTLDVDAAGASSLGGMITGTGGLTQGGAGTTTLANGGNNYSGTTAITAGTLQVGAANALPSGTDVLVSGGTLSVGAFNDTVNSVTLQSGTINGTTGLLTSASDFAVKSGSVSAILDGDVGLDKTTGGTVSLSGTNTYTGATTINGGILDVAGPSGSIAASSSVVVMSGKLEGSGTVSGTTVQAGASLDPGNDGSPAVGTLTASGTVALANNTSNFDVRLNGTGTGTSDTLTASGNVTLGNATLNVAQLAATRFGETFTILTTTGAATIGGTFNGLANLTTFVSGGRTYLIAYTPTSVTLEDVPPAGTVAWIGGTPTAGVDDWSTAANWLLGQMPANNDTVIFDTTTVGFNNVADAFAPHNDLALTGLTLQINDAAATSFNITGNAVTLAAAGITSTVTTAANATVNFAGITLTAITTFTSNSANPLIVGSPIANATFQLMIAGTGNTTLAGAINGTGGLSQTGAGTTTVTATNGYSGGTLISAGILQVGDGTVGHDGSLGTGTVQDGTSLVFDPFGTITVANKITDQGANAGSVTQSGPGTTVLINGTNSYSGGTLISAGILQVGDGTTGHDGSLGTGTVQDGTSLVFDPFGTITVANKITDKGANAGSVSQSGPGTTVLINGTNSYSGGTIISLGVLQVGDGTTGHDGSLGTGTVQDGASLVFDPFGTLTVANKITDKGASAGSVSQSGPGTTVLINGTNSYSGGTIISLGVLQVGDGTTGHDGSLGTGTVQDGASLVFDPFGTLTVANKITDKGASAGSVSQSGPGTTVLINGTNSYSGGTIISLGVLQVGDGTTGHDGSLGTGTVQDGTSLVFDPFGTITVPNKITDQGANAGSVTQNGPGTTVLINGANSYSGGTIISLGVLQVGDGTTGHDGSLGTGTVQDGTSLVFDPFGTITVVNKITDQGANAGSVTQDGLGTTVLKNSANSYAGGTTITLGVLQLGAANSVPGGAVLGDVVVNMNGTFDLNGFDDTINGLSGAGTIDDKKAAAATLTVGGNGHGGTFTGVIRNTGGAGSVLSLTKILGGTLQLANSLNSYSGNTSIMAGVLQLVTNNNAVPGGSNMTGNLSISAGATFDLNGHSDAINGFVAGSTGTIDDTLNGSNSVLTVGNTTTNPSSTFNGVIQNSGSDATLDLTTSGSGTLTLAGNAANTYTGFTTVNQGGTLVLSKPAEVVAVSGAQLSILNNATVQLAATDQINPGCTVTLFGSATLDLNNSSDRIATLNDDSSGAGTVKLGSGDLGLTNGNGTFTGTITGTTGQLILTGNAGTLDSTFGPGVSPDSLPTTDPHGIVVANLGGADTTAGVVIVPQGQPGAGDSILVGTSISGGVSRIVVESYLPNGTLDTTFGTGGKFVVPEPVATTSDTATSVVFDPMTDRIYIGGISTAMNGTNSAALWAVAADGSGLDNTFDATGPNKGELVLTVGADSRLNAIAVDAATDNIVGVGTTASVAEQNPPKLPNAVLVVRVTPNGILDNTFDAGGPTKGELVVTDPVGTNNIDVASSVVIETSGAKDIVVGGSSTVFGTMEAALWFVQTNGSNLDAALNTSIATQGEALVLAGLNAAQVNALALQPDGNILAAGTGVETIFGQSLLLLRVTPAAALDNTFNPTGTLPGVETPNFTFESANFFSQGEALTLLNDGSGRFVVAGTAEDNPFQPNDVRGNLPNFALARFAQDGTLDTFFGNQGLAVFQSGHETDAGVGLGLLPDGDIVMAGNASAVDGGDVVLARLYNGAASAAPAETLSPHTPYANYTGTTVVDGGTLNLTPTTLPASAAVDVGPTGTLSLNGQNLQIGDLSGSGTVSLGSNTLTVGTGNSTAFFGVIQGTGGVTKVGTGTLSYLGYPFNTYSGLTTILNGTLQVGKAEVFAETIPGDPEDDFIAINGDVIIGSDTPGAPSATLKYLQNGQLNDASTVTIESSGHLDFNHFSDDANFPTVVTNTADSGPGSLRSAILAANTLAGGQTIEFNIGSGPFTITLLSALPTITDTAVIDGTSEPGFAGTPIVTVNGSDVSGGSVGLDLLASNSKVLGLAFTGFSGDAIQLQSSNDTVASNVIENNSSNGIDVLSGSNNTIGGTSAASGNVIVNNGQSGVLVQASASGTTIQDNLIGTDAAGDKEGNSVDGIALLDSAATIAGNDVAANAQQGIFVQGPGADGNTITGNQIGTNQAGTVALGNTENGILIGESADNTIAGNDVAANGQNGIAIVGPSADGNTITGNFIGTNKTGTAPLGNTGDGIDLESSSVNKIANNVIGGNQQSGILLHGANTNTIQANDIGTDTSGTVNLGNAADGILISGGQHNLIGGLPTGTTFGSLPAGIANTANLIAFNGGNGVEVAGTAPGNAILGNSIYSNDGSAHVGIQLDGSGANQGLGAPVLTAATTTTITGTYSGAANTQYLLQFFDPLQFVNVPNDPEGKTLVGTLAITTDASGNASFTFTLPSAVSAGALITATATDGQGDTSEFSVGVTALNPPLPPTPPQPTPPSQPTLPQQLPPLPPQLPVLPPQLPTGLEPLPLALIFGTPQVNSLFETQLNTLPDNTGSSLVALVDTANSGEVHGFVFEDLNDNGVRDPDEPGLKGQEIFLDAKDNENPVEGDPVALTDEKGEFHFKGVPAGTYKIRRRAPKEKDYLRSSTKDPYTIKVDPQGTVKDVAFGLIEVHRRRGRGRGELPLPAPVAPVVQVPAEAPPPVGAAVPAVVPTIPIQTDADAQPRPLATAAPDALPWGAWLLAGAAGLAAVSSERPRAQRATKRRSFEMEELPRR